jgi:hypothetical protein
LPLIFVIAIDPLQKLLDIATEKGFNAKLQGRAVAEDLHQANKGRMSQPLWIF